MRSANGSYFWEFPFKFAAMTRTVTLLCAGRGGGLKRRAKKIATPKQLETYDLNCIKQLAHDCPRNFVKRKLVTGKTPMERGQLCPRVSACGFARTRLSAFRQTHFLVDLSRRI